MKRVLLFLAALLVGATVFAQTPKYRPLTSSPFKAVLFASQKVLKGESTTTARVGPLAVASGNYGTERLSSDMPAYDIGSMPVMPLGNPMSQQAALATAQAWMQANAGDMTTRIGSYLKKKGISSGFFTFTQDFNMVVSSDADANGFRPKLMAWNASIDSSGRPVYGSPKIIDDEPIYIVAYYQPLNLVAGLPQGWSAALNQWAGQISYHLVDKTGRVLGSEKHIQTNGAYDQDQSGSDKVACLMDARYPGCSFPIDMRSLLESTGAAAALVDYARQVEPLYREVKLPDGSSEYQAQGAVSYDDRSVSCGILRNSGYFGYALSMSGERYYATPSTDKVQYQAISQFQAKGLSPTNAFSKEISVDPSLNVDQYVINYMPGDDSLLDRANPDVERQMVYVAPVRTEGGGSGGIDPVSMAGDMRVTQTSSSPFGDQKEFYIGTVGDNYWSGGVYDRSVVFNTTNPAAAREFSIIEAGFDDYMLVTLNDHIMFIGPVPGSNMLNVSWASDWVDMGANAGCGLAADGRVTCPNGTPVSTTNPICEGGGDVGLTCSCPPGTSSFNGACAVFAPATFDICQTIMGQTGNGDNANISVSGYRCGNSCPYGMVQYRTNARGMAFENNFLVGNPYGCAFPDLKRSWDIPFAPVLDMRPYLNNGANVLRFLVIVGGAGEGWLKVRTQSCPIPNGVSTNGPAPYRPQDVSTGQVNGANTNYVNGSPPGN